MINFIIPVRHHEMMISQEKTISNLNDLIFSLNSQTSDQWRAYLVCNAAFCTTNLVTSKGLKKITVDFPPNNDLASFEHIGEYYEKFRIDKGRRISMAIELISKEEFVMVLDDDDILHRKAVEILNHQSENSEMLIVSKGYTYDDETTIFRKLDDFHQYCGSSICVKADRYSYVKNYEGTIENIAELGSHKLTYNNLKNAGYVEIADRIVSYRVNHANASTTNYVVKNLRFHKLIIKLVSEFVLKNIITPLYRKQSNLIRENFLKD